MAVVSLYRTKAGKILLETIEDMEIKPPPFARFGGLGPDIPGQTITAPVPKHTHTPTVAEAIDGAVLALDEGDPDEPIVQGSIISVPVSRDGSVRRFPLEIEVVKIHGGYSASVKREVALDLGEIGFPEGDWRKAVALMIRTAAKFMPTRERVEHVLGSTDELRAFLRETLAA